MISLQEAVDNLYRIAIVEKKRQAPNRLTVLADMCVERLAAEDVHGAVTERKVPGISRPKAWDVAWPKDGKVRLGISLKSILSNISGTTPNRVDDLMGEMANVQIRSPEIVTGYIMVFNATGTKNTPRKDGARWPDVFREAANRLTGRGAPAWAPGMVEATAFVEVDFTSSARIVSVYGLDTFFPHLADCLRERNPDLFKRDER